MPSWAVFEGQPTTPALTEWWETPRSLAVSEQRPGQACGVEICGAASGSYVALFELDQQPGITAATLARTCLVTPQVMMTLLKTMEQQGLISRSPDPRHANVLGLHVTDVGREALQAAHERVEVFRELLSRFINAFDKA